MATFTVTLDAGDDVTVEYSKPVMVDYTVGGTAEVDFDYTAPSGTLTIRAPTSAKATGTISIETLAGAAEGDTLTVTFTRAYTEIDTPYTARDGRAALHRIPAMRSATTEIGPASPSPGEASANPIRGFTLFDNANGGADVGALTDGAALAGLTSSQLNIRAEVEPGAEIGSVRMELSGPQRRTHTEGIAPYALFGDKGGRAFPPGVYTVTATAYPEPGLGGTPAPTVSVSFTVAAADTEAAATTVTSSAQAPVSDEFQVTVTFSEPVTGFAMSDLSVANGRATGIASLTDGTQHIIAIAPDAGAAGEVSVTVPAGVATNADGNPNTASAVFRIALAWDPLAGFTLFDNANGGADVQGLSDGAVLEGLTSEQLNIRAEVEPGATIGSVRMELSGPQSRAHTEGIAPYALFGDRGGQAFPPGAYTVTATPYPERDLGGAAGRARSVTFEVALPQMTVADARAEEGEDETLAFAVTLDAATGGQVTVDYATSDGSARAGEDYDAASGTLTFAPGNTVKTITVTVLDDAHDEGEETFTLTLSNASGATLTDAEATGTIENRDPLPRAFMARFGRTVAVQVVEHVEERIQAPRQAGFRGRFAGRELRRGMERELAVEFLNRLGGRAVANRSGADLHTPLAGSPANGAASFGTPGLADGGVAMASAGPMGAAGPMSAGTDGFNGQGLLPMGLGQSDMLTGSDCALNRETRGGILSFWSRGAQSQFAGRKGDLSLDGRVRTTMFGADYETGPLVAGLSMAHSRGRGGYSGADAGEVISSVTGLYPWLGYQVTDRITMWGVTGYGKGALTLTPGAGTALKSGLSMAMAAGSLRGDLADSVVAGFGLAFKADALWVSTGIEGVDGPAGRLAATKAAVTRFRTGLEASRGYSFKRRLLLQPSLEVGLRRDGGDAETGAGVDIGGGLIVSDTLSGLAADVRVRMLLVHQDEGFRERAVSVSLSYNPTTTTTLGFLARVTPSWGGQARSGAQALWGRDTMAGMANGSLASGNRMEAELGYGLPVGSRLVGTPRFGIGSSGHERDYRLGYGLTMLEAGAVSFDLGVDANRRESPGRGGAAHGVQGRLTARW